MVGGKLLHMRCCAHILNLIVRDGLAVLGDGIERVRDSVGFWSATPKRHEKFEKTCRLMNIEYSKRLSLDCKTRWNSTYIMLSIAVMYRDVFDRLSLRENQFNCCPSTADWDFAIEMIDRLKLFYDITTLWSGKHYVTANLFFPKVCGINLAIRKWTTPTYMQLDEMPEQIRQQYQIMQQMSEEMKKKFDKYWSDVHGLMAIATVLDPRYKLHMLQALYGSLYGPEAACTEVARVKLLLRELLVEYQDDSSAGTTHGATAEPVATFVHTELDLYLEEPTLPRTKDFDIINWWKFGGIKFPTLQLIAHDILPIPVTTVASESAFSTSGRILSPHRSRLAPKCVEAIMCMQAWCNADMLGDNNSSLSTTFQTCLDEEDEPMVVRECGGTNAPHELGLARRDNVSSVFAQHHKERASPPWPRHIHDDDIKSVSGGLSPPVHSSLWDGMIQLNSSIKFFMSAFFNSGEKILDIVWPDTIEIKGRVKLEDFQKFVKDLRHSKNRSIMVISLCSKVGSTKDGVGGIQEVAKRFEVNQRVGFAEIENGPYIYICPRNEAVITNLGKYGFWKGVSTVDTNQDSLIGFVVWDRNPLVKTSTTECSIEKVQAIQGSQVEAQDVTDEAEIPDSPSELASKLLVQSSQVTSFRVPSLIASPTSQDLQMSSHDIPSIPLETPETRQHVRPITDSHSGTVQVEEPNSYFHEVKKFTLASKPYKTDIHGLPLDAMGEATPSDLATEKNHIIGGFSGSITQQKYVSTDDSPELQQCPSLLNLHSSHTPDDEEDLPEFFFSPPYGHDIKPNVHSLNNDTGGTGQFQQPSDSFFQAREKIGAQGTSAYIGSSKTTNPISHYDMERDCFRENNGFGDGDRMIKAYLMGIVPLHSQIKDYTLCILLMYQQINNYFVGILLWYEQSNAHIRHILLLIYQIKASILDILFLYQQIKASFIGIIPVYQEIMASFLIVLLRVLHQDIMEATMPPRGFAPGHVWRPMSHPRPGNNHHGFERSDGFSGSRTGHYSGPENGSGSRPSSSLGHW
ncbi:uncharacterized protein LOC124670999 [Lolium rigidum]|uniref:uncharacterized protein LOC124670999 n=1 Tax=Lolium rigidum TaxID=89674 RepID=UPI001F5C1593|nr:uncharacterized protein LOC124670999 [Lolium rigidum]